MVEMTYRDAISHAIAAEMERDGRVVVLGEDVTDGGPFKTLVGVDAAFGAERVRDTPISEMAILGAAMGAALNGLRPVAEMMFADFVGSGYDILVNQIPKYRYMSDGKVKVPMVISLINGGGLRFGSQHSQNVETWLSAVPGLKIVAPSSPADVLRLLPTAIRDDNPVVFLQHKALLGEKEEVDLGSIQPEPLGSARLVRAGDDGVIVSLGAMVPRAVAAAERLAQLGHDLAVLDLRSLVPLDLSAILEHVRRTGFLVTVEENPRAYGWGGEIVSLVAEQALDSLDRAPLRVAMPYAPVPASVVLEDAARPSVDRIVQTVLATMRRSS